MKECCKPGAKKSRASKVTDWLLLAVFAALLLGGAVASLIG